MLNIIFVETSLELVPFQMLRHPSVKRNAKKRGKKPEETLLDRSLHHFGMHNLPQAEKRGRPDIIQICLLEALGSPLNRLGNLDQYLDGRYYYCTSRD
jgi:rRNA small subunit pseudouridine methyltransferase Nep1